MIEPVAAASRVLVIAVGNPSRGDDALGPLLLERVAAAFPGLRTVADFQLQIEHALDLRGAGLVLFVDAACGLEAPFTFHEIHADAAPPVLTHALSAPGVLEVFHRVEDVAPPPAFMLGVRAARFELGEGLSPEAATALAAAWEFARGLLSCPDPQAWRALMRSSRDL